MDLKRRENKQLANRFLQETKHDCENVRCLLNTEHKNSSGTGG